jgi:two-component system nitrate/nitrite response regulator NarL
MHTPQPSLYPLVVEVNRLTQSLEARRARFVSSAALAAPDSGESAHASPALQAVLTDREIQVLNELAKGASNKSIARSLGISTGTVRVHVKSVLRKLALDNRTQAAVWLTTANLEKR